MTAAVRLTLKQPPGLRLDLRGVTPASIAGLDVAGVERLPVGHGNRLVPLGKFFTVSSSSTDGADLVFDGDLSTCDRIGWQSAGGRIEVHGSVGDYVGGAMTGGEITVHGSAGALAACEMSGGRLVVEGDVGDFAASTLPGSMDGMRRGTALVFGNVGDFCASRLVAGTIGVGGSAGAHVGYGQRRGSVVFAGTTFTPDASFVPALVDAVVFWQLLARDLQQHGGPFAGLARRRMRRSLGDVATAGKGELIFAI